MAQSERLIFLDTETTGLDPKLGHKIIEVGAVEAVDRRHTGQHFHRYLNPDREIDAGAVAVHGITNEMLADKPRFFEIANDLAAFLDGATIVIHNAAFDIGFLEAEFGALRMKPTFLQSKERIVDSLAIARAKFPGKRNSLDALCERFGVDNSSRNLHGALLDAKLLADMYFALTREQATIEIESGAAASAAMQAVDPASVAASASEMVGVSVPPHLLEAHRAFTLGDKVTQAEFAEVHWA